MKIILIGAPGVGKGTQASFLINKFNIPQISTGDMLREAISNNVQVGVEAKSYIDKGNLVPDQIIIDLVKERLKSKDCINGYLLDGFPRTLAQARALQKSKILVDVVINIQVRDEVIIDRLSGRRVHLSSGRSYHIKYNPPKVAGKDDVTGENLIQRKDDKTETIKVRLSTFYKQTSPLIDFYKKLAHNSDIKYITVDGEQDIKTIGDIIEKQIKYKI